ncbi:hypothetical protein QA648_26355 (plasmid) [Rhizobium sp. CB3171]|uniref:hypothetical protein n=1 Tax=unclassified Rhizobium TaxID=2613769 RepID=UPI0024B1204E|nr:MULTISPECIES: hypothetical protein [unclassified Rhizobium]MDK4741220.1 hypothetical protein [Rhizobium sp. CNPSo 3464]WFU04314.1 hypothetical protein QA648_26355 [Rhizobium sp. CB3171]
MRRIILLAVVGLITCSCDQTGTSSLQPIPGSITYGGQPRMKLTKSPIGSQVPHRFTDQWGDDVFETYIIQPDRSLRLVDRKIIERPF